MNRRHLLALATVAGLAPEVAARAALRAPGTAQVEPRRVLRAGAVNLTEHGGASAWAIDGVVPSPTLRLRAGEHVRLRLLNELPEPTILHWHGLTVPESADGHPRLAIPTGSHYDYDFQIIDPPGTYWYHPHPHRRTAAQTHQGIAGFLIIEDPDDAHRGLPALDLPLLLQDRRESEEGAFAYRPFGPDLMLGYLGSAGWVNGSRAPVLDVEAARYRLRLLNGCNARILQMRLQDTMLAVVAADGSLLPEPARVDEVMLGPAERVDVVVDLGGAAGRTLRLESSAFTIPGLMTGPRGGPPATAMGGGQGASMLFAHLRVATAGAPPAEPLAGRLRTLPPLPELADLPIRTFHFESAAMRHAINGREFEMERIDVKVPLGREEVWRFVNDSSLVHPVHVHAGSFRVLQRVGGRGRVMPWETGTKDTVLVWPGETVDVLVGFRHYAGRYLLHCHNLEHEDAGMMANFEVLP